MNESFIEPTLVDLDIRMLKPFPYLYYYRNCMFASELGTLFLLLNASTSTHLNAHQLFVKNGRESYIVF